METGKASTGGDKAKALFYETFGAAFVVLAYNLSNGSLLVRAFAYYIGFIIAANVSGAHFNPATSLAVFIVQKKYKEH
jgi:glycerol uptake facilitator-like aquaporin